MTTIPMFQNKNELNNYLALGKKPKFGKSIIATFKVKLGSKFSWEWVGAKIALETSVGVWTDSSKLRLPSKKLTAQVFEINKKENLIKVAYPLLLFEKGNLPQLLSGLTSNIFELSQLDKIRFDDLGLPKKYTHHWPGPGQGLIGIRGFLRVKRRPILSASIEPKTLFSANDSARSAYFLWRCGIDIAKDTAVLTSLDINQFEHRVKRVLALKKKAERELGLGSCLNLGARFYRKFFTNKNPQGRLGSQKKLYFFNVTATPEIMLERAKIVKKAGGKGVMLDIGAVGLDNAELLRRANLDLIICGYKGELTALTQDPNQGISDKVIFKLSRLAGLDILDIGRVNISNKKAKEEARLADNILVNGWSKFKPVLPNISCELYPSAVFKMIEVFGRDLIVDFEDALRYPIASSAKRSGGIFRSMEAAIK